MVFLETDDSSRRSWVWAPKYLHKLLSFELVWQLAEALIVAGGAAALYKLFVLVGKVVEGHLAEVELLLQSEKDFNS